MKVIFFLIIIPFVYNVFSMSAYSSLTWFMKFISYWKYFILLAELSMKEKSVVENLKNKQLQLRISCSKTPTPLPVIFPVTRTALVDFVLSVSPVCRITFSTHHVFPEEMIALKKHTAATNATQYPLRLLLLQTHLMTCNANALSISLEASNCSLAITVPVELPCGK